METQLVFTLCLIFTVVSEEIKPADDVFYNDPAECFYYYGQLERSANVAYEKSLLACWGEARSERVEVDDSFKAERKDIEQTTSKSNAELSACNKQVYAFNFFNCYSKAPDEKSMFRIRQLAAQVYDKISEEYRLIEVKENRCQKSADQAHAQEKYKILEGRTDCIYNRKPLPEVANPYPNTSASKIGMKSEFFTLNALKQKLA